MKLTLSVDRFEGDNKQIAVLLADDGAPINIARRLLPKGVKAGDILSVTIEKDAEATRQVTAQTSKVQDELKRTDPGGDLRL